MPLDHYVTLGRSGLRVSPLCLGTMTFGEDWGWGSSVADSKAIIDAFMAAGGNFFDTANIYTKGHSEVIIGDHLGSDPGRRQRAVIATKFTGNLYRNDPNGGGAGRKSIIQQCENSLRRLQTDYIDVYWMHMWDMVTPIDETMRALDDLVRSGKVRYIGASDTPAWKISQAQMIAEMRNLVPFVGLQIEYSLLERTVEAELIPMAQELGLGVTPWSPLKSGVLTGKFKRGGEGSSRGIGANMHLTDKTFDLLDVMHEAASALDTTPARIAINWVHNRPGVTSTIIGARTMAQLEDNVAALDVRLPADLVAKLEAATTPDLPFPIDILNHMRGFGNGGATVNGHAAEAFYLAPVGDDDRY